jgi:Bifunctional DNA primase/polymerase, N-terminal
MTDTADIRCALLAAGFLPLPLRGKKPAFDEWQKKLQTNDAEIRLWGSMWPNATNTGILTKFTPAIDIDIMVPDAAAATEELVREWFGEHGNILVRFGKVPKRAVLLRTDEPFKKIVGLFTAPDGSEQKSRFSGTDNRSLSPAFIRTFTSPIRGMGANRGRRRASSCPTFARASCARSSMNRRGFWPKSSAFSLRAVPNKKQITIEPALPMNRASVRIGVSCLPTF